MVCLYITIRSEDGKLHGNAKFWGFLNNQKSRRELADLLNNHDSINICHFVTKDSNKSLFCRTAAV